MTKTRRKYASLLYILIVCAAVIFTALFLYQYIRYSKSDISKTAEYENTLFDTDYVHTINIVMNDSDWEDLIENATEKEYHICDVIIDGETFHNVAIRAKGNSSMMFSAFSGTGRYSFKLEFDHFQDGKSAWGLDKLSLNNIISDNTYMKDYLSYTLMNEMGANAPLCSYMNITVNGDDFGLYLGVEGIEEAFCKRNYGSADGKLYKPEVADIFGGDFNIEDMNLSEMFGEAVSSNNSQDTSNSSETAGNTDSQDSSNESINDTTEGISNHETIKETEGSAVALQYLGNSYSSYKNIFNNAIFDITDTDKERLIDSIKQLNEGNNLDKVVNIEEVLRYFVVHSFVCNNDSYTSNMQHNYYIYEENGKISIIAWDYNQAFTGSMFPSTSNTIGDSTKYINYPIDTPVDGCNMQDRPLLNELLSNDEYLAKYHEYYEELLSKYLERGKLTSLINDTANMIAPYVEKDPSKYCTYEEFKLGVNTLKEFCNLRTKSIRGQLDGNYPITLDKQTWEEGAYVDAAHIDLSEMGTLFSDIDMSNMPDFSNVDMSNMPDFSNFDMSNMPDFSNFDMSNMPDMSKFDMSDMPDLSSSSGFSLLSGLDFFKAIKNAIYLAVSIVVLVLTLIWVKLMKRRMW